MSGFETLIRRLAQVAGLSDEDAEAVLETAVDYIKAKRPDQAEKVDAALSDEKTTQRIGDLVAKLAEKAKPET